MQPVPTSSRPARTLTIHILRYNPQDRGSVPRLESYTVEEWFGMTLFFVLNEIRERYDSALQTDFFCGSGYCGSCSMVINGKPGLACKTLTKPLGAEITLLPLPGFALIGDLSIDMRHGLEGIDERLQAWIQASVQEHDGAIDIARLKDTLRPRLIDSPEGAGVELERLEARLEPELAEAIYKLQSCIDCGCCIATHGTLANKSHFAEKSALTPLAALDTPHGRYELMSDGRHVFGLIADLECENICPKQLPLDAKAAYLIRKIDDLQDGRIPKKAE